MPSGLFGVITGFTAFFGTRERGRIKTSNAAFRLHYGFTSGIFFLATAILSLNELFGKAIVCQGNNGGHWIEPASQAVVQYCWVSGTYTVPTARGGAHRGLGHHDTSTGDNGKLEGEYCKMTKKSNEDVIEYFRYTKKNNLEKAKKPKELDDKDVPECRRYLNYYQWVPYVLVFLGLLFLCPHRLWKSLEEGKMKGIAGSIREAQGEPAVVTRVAGYIFNQGRRKEHKRYAYGYFFCTGLNLLTVIGSLGLLNEFIGREFLTLGSKFLGLHSMVYPILEDVFPRNVMCQWHAYGTGGKPTIDNFICLLATNAITEKVFVFLWFWLFFLLLLDICVITYFGLLLFSGSPEIRNYFLTFAVRTRRKNYGKEGSKKGEEEEERLAKYLRGLPGPNFLFLYMLSGNVDRGTLLDILKELEALNLRLKSGKGEREGKSPEPSAPPMEQQLSRKSGESKRRMAGSSSHEE